MNDQPNVLFVVGPTATGKTSLSVELAYEFDGEIISADSMQIYESMMIGSARPDDDEKKDIPHLMMGVISPLVSFSAALYREKALDAVSDISNRGKLPIITGGTGLYINSLLYPMNFTNAEKDEAYREEMYLLADKKGKQHLHDKLELIDLKTADRLHVNDIKRVIRALEIYHITGRTLSSYKQDLEKQEPPVNPLLIGLIMERSKLYERIEKRVDIMLEKGLVDEVKMLYDMGCTRDMTSMQGIGYKEILDYFDGLTELEAAVDKIKQESRRYAKRQLTWFKRNKSINWFNYDDYDSVKELSKSVIKFIQTDENSFLSIK